MITLSWADLLVSTLIPVVLIVGLELVIWWEIRRRLKL